MLNRLRLENFKAWREADLTFGKVTGFFGANSAGKSSLLQFLLLLKHTRNATDRGSILDFGGPRELVNLGGFTDVVHGHAEDERIRWILDWMLPQPLKITDPEKPAVDRVSPAHACRPSSKSATTTSACGLGSWPTSSPMCVSGCNRRRKRNGNSHWKPTAGNFRFKRTQGRAWPLSHPVKTYLFPNEVRSYYQNADFLGKFELAYEKLMDSLYYLGPLREYPHREYHWSGSSRRASVSAASGPWTPYSPPRETARRGASSPKRRVYGRSRFRRRSPTG